MKQRKYNLPAHVCWDVTCDLYHANFIIDKVRYSVKKKTIKEAMKYVADKYYSTNKWSFEKTQEYLNTYDTYKDLDNPETRRINSKLKLDVKIKSDENKIDMLKAIAKSCGHNKDELSLKYKAITTLSFLNYLKDRTDGMKPDNFSYDNDLGGFVLVFNGIDCKLSFIINRHKIKIEVYKKINDDYTRIGLKLYSLKEFYNGFIRCYPNKGFLQSVVNKVCSTTNINTIKDELSIDQMKEVLCNF